MSRDRRARLAPLGLQIDAVEPGRAQGQTEITANTSEITPAAFHRSRAGRPGSQKGTRLKARPPSTTSPSRCPRTGQARTAGRSRTGRAGAERDDRHLGRPRLRSDMPGGFAPAVAHDRTAFARRVEHMRLARLPAHMHLVALGDRACASRPPPGYRGAVVRGGPASPPPWARSGRRPRTARHRPARARSRGCAAGCPA